MATTEGALVASATRGATALTRSGGVSTRVVRQRMLRVPMFVMEDMRGAALFERWVQDHVPEIRQQVGLVSRHAKLISLEPRMLGNMVHVAFVYETGDAAGQNMTTTCTWKSCQWMMQQMAHHAEIRFDNFIIEANLSGDKKVNYNSFISGRGTRVLAEAFVDEDILQQVLKVSSDQLLRAHNGFVAGSIQSGMIGYNINVANIVGAIFTSCGQDIACVHESSLAQLHLESVEGGLYASMVMPSLIVGTVGGGTHLANQKDYLDMMGCSGAGNSRRFAEIVAGFCLALDLSTLSAIASGQFATAHEKLGRNRPVEWLKEEDLTPNFFTAGLQVALGEPDVEVTQAAPIRGFKTGSSIVTELTARKVNKLVGHFPFVLTYKNRSGATQNLDVMAKVKPLDSEVVLMINSMVRAVSWRHCTTNSRTTWGLLAAIPVNLASFNRQTHDLHAMCPLSMVSTKIPNVKRISSLWSCFRICASWIRRMTFRGGLARTLKRPFRDSVNSIVFGTVARMNSSCNLGWDR